MRTITLILLLLSLLAPRLTVATMPHALACAGPASTYQAGIDQALIDQAPVDGAAGAVSADKHSTHVRSGHGHSDPHAGHHASGAHGANLPAASGTPQADAAQADLSPSGHASSGHSPSNAADNGNCQHCGDCDDHCSAVLLTDLPRLTEPHASLLLATANSNQQRGFSHDLNRPPRTASL